MAHDNGTTPPPIRGLHHVTAIAKDPKKNVAFYTRVLGLRLVKQTVNFDDPGTYHLYFADGAGTPGSVLTFFPWPNVARGELGAGETKATMFAITERSVPFWLRRLSALRVEHDAPVQRFDETVIAVRDHDGMRLELVASARHEGIGFAEVQGSDVPAEHALRGFAGVSLVLRSASKTIDLLTRTLGYAEVGNSDGITRLMARGTDAAQGAVMGRIIDVHEDQGAQRGRTGSGTVHHIAFRTKDDAEQRAWQDALAQRGLHATEILDRQYFHSIYVREPGGVLLEFATDAPGFAVDEPLATLGQELKLPAQYEGMRDALRARLPALVE
jgi:glyoxalase family protein